MDANATQKFAAELHETLQMGEVAVKRCLEMEKAAEDKAAQLRQLAPSIARQFVLMGGTKPEFEKEAAELFANDPVRTLRTFSNFMEMVASQKKEAGNKNNAPKPLGRSTESTTQLNPVDAKWFNQG